MDEIEARITTFANEMAGLLMQQAAQKVAEELGVPAFETEMGALLKRPDSTICDVARVAHRHGLVPRIKISKKVGAFAKKRGLSVTHHRLGRRKMVSPLKKALAFVKAAVESAHEARGYTKPHGDRLRLYDNGGNFVGEYAGRKYALRAAHRLGFKLAPATE